MDFSKRLPAGLAVGAVMILAMPSIVSGQDATEGTPEIVVTTEVLGAVVRDVVADAAEVTVLMDAGADPHTWQPSARDGERVMQAALVVENGLGLEEGLIGLMEQARAEGVPVFTATDHIEVMASEDEHEHADEDGDHDEDEHADEDEHEHADDEHAHGPEDPHFWLDPVAMEAAVEGMVPALGAIGLDVSSSAAGVIEDLEALDAEIEAILSGIDDGERKLVTGHEALAYFADRYGFELVGTVIPGQTTSSEASARDIADLIDTIGEEGVSVVFTDVGTPQSIARTVADEGGAELIELRVAQLPADGSYRTLMLEIATTVAEATAAPA